MLVPAIYSSKSSYSLLQLLVQLCQSSVLECWLWLCKPHCSMRVWLRMQLLMLNPAIKVWTYQGIEKFSSILLTNGHLETYRVASLLKMLIYFWNGCTETLGPGLIKVAFSNGHSLWVHYFARDGDILQKVYLIWFTTRINIIGIFFVSLSPKRLFEHVGSKPFNQYFNVSKG